MQQNIKKAKIVPGLATVLTLGLLASFAQAATFFSGEASNPNLSISLPGGISVIVKEQTSSSGGTSGSMAVNALHVTGPSIDIIVASAQSDVTCRDECLAGHRSRSIDRPLRNRTSGPTLAAKSSFCR